MKATNHTSPYQAVLFIGDGGRWHFGDRAGEPHPDSFGYSSRAVARMESVFAGYTSWVTMAALRVVK